MEKQIELPSVVWAKLNLSWALFFLAVGFANIYVVYHFSTDAWVNFKLFGVLGLTLVFFIFQAIYLSRHITEDSIKKKS